MVFLLVVFLWWCFCDGVFVFFWWCFCGGVVVFLRWCGEVFVVVFLWGCFCGGVLAVVFLSPPASCPIKLTC